MAKLVDLLDKNPLAKHLESKTSNYAEQFKEHKVQKLLDGDFDHAKIAVDFYTLTSDFMEYGWGQSFHFAPRAVGESFEKSIARHEHLLALKLDLKEGMRVADIGSGIGGPMREIARLTGATIACININEYQQARASEKVEEEGLSHLAEFLVCDFLNIDSPDDSFDAAYAIESSCYAPTREDFYRELYRILKPGASFASYECCLTNKYDESNSQHRGLKHEIMAGGGLHNICTYKEVDAAVTAVGFEVLETEERATRDEHSISWYAPLSASGFSLRGLRTSAFGRRMTHATLWFAEKLRIVPKGTVRVSAILNRGGDAMCKAGELDIFTPMYLVVGRKPN